MAGDDDDKTVIGGKLPNPNDPAFGRPQQPPAPQPNPFGVQPPPQPTGGDRTVIGGALPQGQPPQQPGHPNPIGAPPAQGGNTWLGGALPPTQQPAQPYPQPTPHQPPRPAPGSIGTPQHNIGSPFHNQNDGFFPELPRQQAAPQPMQTPRISLAQALQATGLGKGGSSNPLVASAANLLILFGRLRTGMVEMDAMPLMDHVTREIDAFERNAVAKGVDPHEALVAKYALCGTADDIVQNLPGADRGLWIQYSMVARFFQKRDSGVGFFQEAEKAMQSPGQYYNLLELMLTCLSLGFEGQYRTQPNGSVDLARIRTAIYETLRRVNPRPDEDLSVKWTPVLLGGRRRFGGIPVWIIAGIAAAILVSFFGTLSTLINRDGAQAAQALLTLHPTAQKIALERTAGPVYVAKSTQLERIQEAFSDEIDQGLVSVGTKGEYIYVRVGNLLLFDSGQATVKAEFAPLAAHIAETLNTEDGPIRILGFTDSIQPSGRGRYKTNLDLSVARAKGVADVIAPLLQDPLRIEVEGRGPADPIADNGTKEGRAANRRVEVMIAREGTF